MKLCICSSNVSWWIVAHRWRRLRWKRVSVSVRRQDPDVVLTSRRSSTSTRTSTTHLTLSRFVSVYSVACTVVRLPPSLYLFISVHVEVVSFNCCQSPCFLVLHCKLDVVRPAFPPAVQEIRLGLAIVPLCRGTGAPLRRTQAPPGPFEIFW